MKGKICERRLSTRTPSYGRVLSVMVGVVVFISALFFLFDITSQYSFVLADTTETETDKSGVITYLEGSAQKKKAVNPDWIAAYVQSTVEMGDTMKTLQSSRAELEINWDTIIRLSENTVVDFVKLFQDVNKKFVAADVEVAQGEIWGSIDSLSDDSAFSVGDTVARAEIRGTTFRYQHSDSGTKIKVYSGAVSVQAVRQVQGPTAVGAPQEVSGPAEVSGPQEVTMEQWTVLVKSMQEMVITPDGAKPTVRDFDATESEEQSDWVQWNKERDNQRKQHRKGELKGKTNR
ncbi:FecR domain-containing protein [candidate division CSSED10-310 bacterium]|uniref:FecR domain-containing protein n=1 Tax=candidate division CSSED10-310 bacterium TaxID=2855610 RepID=A0ABV6Z4R9_UNCC1